MQEAEEQFNTAVSIVSLCEVLDDLYEQTGDKRFHKAWTSCQKIQTTERAQHSRIYDLV